MAKLHLRARSRLSASSAAWLIGSAILITGCLGSQRQGPMGGFLQDSPIVEAYVEYAGPADRWAGPVSFLLHVSARDGEKVKLEVSPVSFFEKQPDAIEVIHRVPSSAGAQSATGSSKTAKVPQATAQLRERMAALAEAIESSRENFQACLYPVRVRMIRQDGGIKEWEGCRASRGWPKAVSEFTDSVFKG